MKKVFILMLGLVAGTASFAQTTEPQSPVATISVTSDQKLRLVISRENAKASVILRDTQGHVLYNSNVSLIDGLMQKFNLSELALGTYKLAVIIGDEVIEKTFTIDEQPAQKLVALRS
jgi:hypothetical protein